MEYMILYRSDTKYRDGRDGWKPILGGTYEVKHYLSITATLNAVQDAIVRLQKLVNRNDMEYKIVSIGRDEKGNWFINQISCVVGIDYIVIRKCYFRSN